MAIAEAGGIHAPFVEAAKVWLNQLAAKNQFAVDYIQNTDKIDDEFLSHYQLFIQLNYPPYNWTPTAQAAFIKYIEEGRGGWIGFHHATLLGEFDGFQMWPWFSQFMGGIRFKEYIATFADGVVTVEDKVASRDAGSDESISGCARGMVHMGQVAATQCSRACQRK